jgi:hypothetical protein
MMLRSLGLDPDELKANVEGFMVTMKAAVEKVEANQLRIESKLEHLSECSAAIILKLDTIIQEPLSFQGTSRPIFEDGKHTGVILTDEKFPQPLYNGEASNYDPLKAGVQGVHRDGR